MRSIYFEETRPWRDVCHQRYIRAAKNRHFTCTHIQGMHFAKFGPGQIWTHHGDSTCITCPWTRDDVTVCFRRTQTSE